jgi:hypothetical protein
MTHTGKYSAWKNGGIEQSDTINRQRSQHKEEDWIVVPDLIPPIITDRDLFARANATLVANRKRTSPSKDRNYLFTHALVCHDCGAFMRGFSECGQKKYICSTYKEDDTDECYRNTISEKPLLDSILAVLLDDVLNPARLDAIEKEMQRQLEVERDKGGVERLKKQIGVLERDIDQGNARLLRVSEDMVAGVEAKIREWKQERDKLRVRLGELEGADGDTKKVLDEARRQLWRLRESLEGNDEEAQATVIREVVSRIELRFDHIETHGWRSKTGKKRPFNRPSGAILYVRPGLGLSCLCTFSQQSPRRA